MTDIQNTNVVFEKGGLERQVAVIVPLYNYAGLIEWTLDSVAEQSHHDIVLIVVDDKSDDTSLAIALDWMADYEGPISLRLLSNNANFGLSATRNLGIVHSQSPYCFFLDADNEIYPRCIARHVAALECRSDCAGSYSIIEQFEGATGLKGNNVFTRDALARGNYIDAMAMVRRECLDKYGGFRAIKYGWEDYDLWLRLAEGGDRLLHIPQILSRYRHHRNSMSRQQTNKAENVEELRASMRELHPWLKLDNAIEIKNNSRGDAQISVHLQTKARPAPRRWSRTDQKRQLATATYATENNERLTSALIDEGIFDERFYIAQLPGFDRTDVSQLIAHYIEFGERQGLAPSGRFDPNYYRKFNPDLAHVEVLIHHYLHNGAKEGRKASLAMELIADGLDLVAIKAKLIPKPEIDTADRSYLNTLAELLRQIDIDPTFFSRQFYCWRYPDIDPNQIDPLLHYLKFGRHEGRVTNVALMKRLHRNSSLINTRLPYIIVGVHEASTTGAPIVGFDFASEVSKDHNVIFISLKGGKLIERAKGIFPIVIEANSIDEDNDFFIEYIFENFLVKDAIFSSSACIPFMRPLSTRPIKIICLVHEFLEYMLHTHAIIYVADFLVFSSHALLDSWQHMIDDLSRQPDSILVLPQPASSSTARLMDKAAARAIVSESTGLDLNGATLVLGAGHVQIRKGTDIFLQIGNQLRRSDEKFVSIWIGEQISPFDMVFGVWFHAQMERSRDETGRIGVHFEPAGPLYPVLMDAADVFIVTSRLDPLPNVALDAAVREIPVIAFAGATGLPDVAALGQVDLIEVEIGAIDEVVEAVKSIRSGRGAASDIVVRPTGGYSEYRKIILDRAAEVAKSPRMLVDLDIEVDYTGPAHATPFDSFATDHQREVSRKQIRRLLELGIVAINPRPGVHAARQNGDFTRYRSLLAERTYIDRLPDNMLFHIHAFYPDVVREMLSYFKGDALNGRFFITTTTDNDHKAIAKIVEKRGFTNCKIVLIDNRGRDIGPFLDYAVDFASAGDVICHVHTKKSPDVGGNYGEKWRKQLYGALLTQTAIDAFRDPALGLLFPDTPRTVGWGKNRIFCAQIATHFGTKLKSHPGPMPVGNMFFTRVEVANAMRNATKDFDWPREPVPYDGTILHAIERMWTEACDYSGLSWAAIHSAYGDNKIETATNDDSEE
ncbi:rhamnan synthesis F family protein [Novosphingobium sp.]|uniref:rhamnan synthesis F family protein n=1 Tax=Novosphingobium sp. TaxID=1874826 RepID=UPI003D0A78BC